MELVLITILALALNMGGALLAKYLAMNIGPTAAFVVLFLLLCVVYVMQVVFWILVGKRWQLSYIYPFLSINYVFSFVLGIYLFSEPFLPRRLLGACIIACGVVVLSLSRHKQERAVR